VLATYLIRARRHLLRLRRLARPSHPSARDADARAIETAYVAATARLIRRRLQPTIALLVIFVGISVLLEQIAHPDRVWQVGTVYLAEVLICLVAYGMCRTPRFAAHATSIAATMGSLLAVLNGVYIRLAGDGMESLAMAQVCLMTSLVILVPWGWRAQLVVGSAALAGFVLACVQHPPVLPAPWAALGVVVGATTSLAGAFFLERYRRAAFVRAALLKRLSRLQAEEAEISSALLHVAHTLSQNVGRAGALEHVNRLAVDVLGCDWSTTIAIDGDTETFRLVADVGSPPALSAELGGLDLPCNRFPLLARLRPAEVFAATRSELPPLVPAELLDRWDFANALFIPIQRDGDVVGVIVTGYRTRLAPFSDKQHRLALGIADAVAIALDNERLIGDLQAANRLKSDFVSTMSHELRTPLNVILGYTEMLGDRDEAWSRGVSVQLAQRIRRSAVELLELVNDTLDLARLEAGRDVLSEGPVDLGGLFGEVEAELEALAAQKGLTLRWHDGAGSVAIVTDRGKLKTILKNLVGNALKYTHDGSVDVAAWVRNGELTLEVRDTGIGIASSDLTVIFDMFRQVDGQVARPFGGVGLGLHIVKQLVERLRGTIVVESTPRVGSTFTVRLPVGVRPRVEALPAVARA